jgi:hypothetical protein
MSAALELQHLDDSDGDKEQSLVVQVCNLISTRGNDDARTACSLSWHDVMA